MWKEHTYPSEPKEIDFFDWLQGYIKQIDKEEANDIKTNADRIRNMTDEELAEFIHKTIFDQGSNLFTCEEPPVNCHEECKECYMDWLQKEVE